MRTALAAAFLALAACGADLQIDRACATSGTGITAPARPAVPAASVPVPPVRLSFAFGDAVPDLSKNGVHDVHVLARSFDLTSTQGTDFVTSLTVAVVPPAGSALAHKTIGTYQRPASGAASNATTLSVAADGTDLFPYLETGRLTLEVSGVADPSQLPTTPSTVGAAACAEVQGSVNYFKAAGL